MYNTANGKVNDDEAAIIENLNHEIWETFWKIPRDKRTREHWEKLFDIQILVKSQ